MKILVADDSKTNLALITTSLENLGHEVIAASSGRDAIKRFQLSRPDLIILDVVMSGMDGFECAKAIREICKDDWIPIIFLSGSVNDDSIAKGIDAGGDDYLTKPYSEITLAAKIKAMQRIASMRQDLLEATEKLSTLSSTDALTGVNNRLQFNKIFQEQIATADRQQVMLALLSLDLDKFKLVNDTYGHHIGDLLLIEVTRRLQSCLRVNDFLARMGGDEFVIILNHIENKQVVAVVAQKIINALSSPFNLEGEIIHCSSSIGIAFYPEDGFDKSTLSKNADIALYHTKKTGRNNYQYFNKILPHYSKLEKKGESNELSIHPTKSKISVLNCLVNETPVCINMLYINKSLPLPLLQPLPNSPYYLVGLMNLAGRSVRIIDLGERLNIRRTQAYSLDTPILLCADQHHCVGFIVDKIIGLYEIEYDAIQMPPEGGDPTSFIIGAVIINQALSLLVNMPRLLIQDLSDRI